MIESPIGRSRSRTVCGGTCLIYQHATRECGDAIAAGLDTMVRLATGGRP